VAAHSLWLLALLSRAALATEGVFQAQGGGGLGHPWVLAEGLAVVDAEPQAGEFLRGEGGVDVGRPVVGQDGGLGTQQGLQFRGERLAPS